MFEFDDIFANGLTTAVYVYGSLGILVAYALGALWMFRQPASAPQPRWTVRRA